jgi:hypothetical protein
MTPKKNISHWYFTVLDILGEEAADLPGTIRVVSAVLLVVVEAGVVTGPVVEVVLVVVGKGQKLLLVTLVVRKIG